jgi:cytochrome b561
MSNSTSGATMAPTRYDPFMRVMHWGMFLLLVAVCALVELHEIFPKGSSGRSAMMALHMALGVTALAALLPRVFWRVVQKLRGALPDDSDLPPWQRLLALATQLALYALLVLLPVTGYLSVALDAHTVEVFGLFTLPAIGAGDHDLAHNIKEVHEAMATTLYVLVAAHIAAALWHHFALRDDVMRRMSGTRD